MLDDSESKSGSKTEQRRPKKIISRQVWPFVKCVCEKQAATPRLNPPPVSPHTHTHTQYSSHDICCCRGGLSSRCYIDRKSMGAVYQSNVQENSVNHIKSCLKYAASVIRREHFFCVCHNKGKNRLERTIDLASQMKMPVVCQNKKRKELLDCFPGMLPGGGCA